MIDEAPITRHERLRRTILMCGICLRNIAYYSAGWDGKMPRFIGRVHTQTNTNFIHMAILEWCKLFGDPRHEPQHWQNIIETIAKRKAFKDALIEHVGGDRHDWNTHRTRCINYRNDFLAHLGSGRAMQLPHLDMCRRSVFFYSTFVHEHEMTYGPIDHDPNVLYQHYLEEGLAFYGVAKQPE